MTNTRVRAQRFRRALEFLAKQYGRTYQEAKDVAIRHLRGKAKLCECRADWFCDTCHNEAMEDVYGSYGQG